jgi:asparagine synthase (glutamine-hydrolysing)
MTTGADRSGRAESHGFVELDEALDAALGALKRRWDGATVLFSGGVDSGLLAWELRGVPGVRLATVGLPGSQDLAAGSESAVSLNIPWEGLEASPEEVRDLAALLEQELCGQTSAERSVQTALALAILRSPGHVLVCGQGADELFGGYDHFRGLTVPQAERRAAVDLEKLLRDDWPLTVRLSRRFGRPVEAPYLDPRFLEAAQRIPSRVRLRGDPRKAFFRAWAAHRGVPELIASRPKKAFQYGSGVERVLRQVE